MGLGSVSNNNGVFLSIAGGFIWDRKADETNADYATQEYINKDKSIGVRKGAMYQDLTGKVTGVYFKTHPEYGQNINVNFEDEDDNRYIISIKTNNRYSQDMMRMLLKADLSKSIFMRTHDFFDKDKKRVTGISFKQNGRKLNIRNDDSPSHESDWFKNSTKKQIKRYFEDLSDWYVAEVEEKVCSQFSGEKEDKKQEAKQTENPVEENNAKAGIYEISKATPLKMKKAIKAYIAENYKEESLPDLSKGDLVKWYELVLEGEELPFNGNEESEPNSEVKGDLLNDRLDALIE